MRGDDALLGDDGNDTLIGGAGVDSLAGGAGDDFYDEAQIADVVSELSGEGIDTVRTRLDDYVLPDNVENLIMFGSFTVNGDGNDLANTITGTEGDNILRGFVGDDILHGRNGADILDGHEGADTLDGGSGDDILQGGAGDDLYDRVDFFDSIFEASGAGIDTVRTRADNYVLGDNLENLILFDSAVTGSGNALFNEIVGNGAANVLHGMDGGDALEGGGRGDRLHGGNGVDSLEGGVGNDLLDGGSDGDVLVGGVGRDTIIAGAGNDLNIFEDDGDFAGLGPNSADRITDFSQADRDLVDLFLVDAVEGTAGSSFAFVGEAAFSGAAGELRFVQRDAGFTMIQGDTDGDGAADFAIRLDGLIDLTSADFVL